MCITLFLRPGWGGGVRDLYLLEKICNIYKDRNTTKRERERERGGREGGREKGKERADGRYKGTMRERRQEMVHVRE